MVAFYFLLQTVHDCGKHIIDFCDTDHTHASCVSDSRTSSQLYGHNNDYVYMYQWKILVSVIPKASYHELCISGSARQHYAQHNMVHADSHVCICRSEILKVTVCMHALCLAQFEIRIHRQKCLTQHTLTQCLYNTDVWKLNLLYIDHLVWLIQASYLFLLQQLDDYTTNCTACNSKGLRRSQTKH